MVNVEMTRYTLAAPGPLPLSSSLCPPRYKRVFSIGTNAITTYNPNTHAVTNQVSPPWNSTHLPHRMHWLSGRTTGLPPLPLSPSLLAPPSPKHCLLYSQTEYLLIPTPYKPSASTAPRPCANTAWHNTEWDRVSC